jgi:hypothetical protein
VTRLGLGTVTLLLLSRPAVEAMEVPLVNVLYSAEYDEVCAGRVESTLDPDAVAEVDELLPQLEAAWNDSGPPLLAAAGAAVGRPFRFQRATARLLTCGAASRSRPLVINIRPYLRSTSGRRRVALRQFASTVVHEVLHRYVSDLIYGRWRRETPLLGKYAGEHEEVRDHLHLFALEEVAYRRTGREAELRDVQAFESRLVNARLFARSREIVRAEGAEAFLKELRASS